jgi:hypothetical protein
LVAAEAVVAVVVVATAAATAVPVAVAAAEARGAVRAVAEALPDGQDRTRGPRGSSDSHARIPLDRFDR